MDQRAQPDVFRRNYMPLTEDQKQSIYHIKNKAEELYLLLDCYENREMSLAKTKIEECVMWAVKALSDQSLQPKGTEAYRTSLEKLYG